MEIKSTFLQKLFSAHVPGCFGASDHDLLQPKSRSVRSRIFFWRKTCRCRQRQQEWKTRDGYMDIKSMAHGSEARTYLTRSISTSRVYIVKRFTDYRVPNEESLAHRHEQPQPNEATVLLQALKPHPNILQAFGCDLFGGRISNLYTQYCSGGDLQQQMARFLELDRTPPERFVLHVFISLADVLCYIHHGLRWNSETKKYVQEPGFDTPYVHADLKSENAFLSWSDEAKRRGLPDIILGDWGAAQPVHSYRGISGTPGYQAPEVAAVYKLHATDRQAYRTAMATTGYMTPAADVFSLGQTIHKLCTGREHIVGADPDTFPVRTTDRGMIGVKLGRKRAYDTEALEKTVKWCLRKNPKMRPKTEEGSLLGAIAIFRDAFEKMEKDPVIPHRMWASPPSG